MKVGIVGCGFAAHLHANGYKRLPGIEIVGIAELEEERAKKFKEEFSIPHAYKNYEEMFEKEDLDLVSICVPNFLHKDVFVSAAKFGKKNIVCEKALAASVEDAEEMVKISKEKKINLMYAEDWIFAPPLKRAKEIFLEGAIGDILWIKAREAHSGSHSSFAQKISTCGGGAMLNLGVHPIGFVLWFKEKEVKKVWGKCSGGGENNFVHKKLEGEDWGIGVITFSDSTHALVEGNYITCGGMEDIIEIYGTEGIIKINLSPQGSPLSVYSRKGFKYAVEKADFTTGWTRPAFEEEWTLGYYDEIAHFINCAKENKPPIFGATAEEGLIALKIVKKIYESNKDGEVKNLD